jgi:serine phosphatase RsbU (regulator of sigma subunit)/anti-sigma regulatory factor (Ser/Thr protein kinase)
LPLGYSSGAGQQVLSPAALELAPDDQIRALYRLSDPALSELGLDEFLDEMLMRVRQALRADTVAILLLDEDANELVARAAKGIEDEVEAGVRIPLGRGFAGRIAAGRMPIFVADVSRADVVNPLLREKGIRSLLGVPLIVEGDLIGVLHVGSLTPRTYDERDLAVLQLAAARAAPGIERARLFSALEHEHRVTVALQRSLLPRRLAQTPSVTADARYLAASEEVGGDWYDVFELPGGRIGVTIGDVVGHGVRAAVLMGRLRTALRAYAILDNSPRRTLELVNDFIQSMADGAMATAVYAVLDPDAERLCVASAGHPSPIICGGSSARILHPKPAAPLGAFAFSRFHELEEPLVPGEALVLYTDGLVERRGTPIEDNIQRLLELVCRAGTPDEICQAAFEGLVSPEGLRDDIAVVAIQLNPLTAELELSLPCTPHSLAYVRHTMQRWLRLHGPDPDSVGPVLLAVSEACSNAIQHGGSVGTEAFEVHARVEGGYATIVVSDPGPWRLPRDQLGHGLAIMEATMDEVDVRKDETGTVVVMRRRISR